MTKLFNGVGLVGLIMGSKGDQSSLNPGLLMFQGIGFCGCFTAFRSFVCKNAGLLRHQSDSDFFFYMPPAACYPNCPQFGGGLLKTKI